jgi:hypothetical protein
LTAHARYFAGRENDILALWDSPRQREAYTWFTTELTNLRTAFRWAADQGDLDVAAPIATYAAWVGLLTENYEPIAWAGSPEAELASMPTPGRRTAMRRSDRAVEAIAKRAPWIVRGMARLAPATERRGTAGVSAIGGV